MFGDNDPVDVVEIGSKPFEVGSIVPVRVLGAFALIDDGELDWKIIAINAEDPLASKVQDVNDLQRESPAVISGIREWFRWYKTPTGTPLNEFGFNAEVIGRAETLEVRSLRVRLNFRQRNCPHPRTIHHVFPQVIEETHAYWQRLVDGKADKDKLWTRS